MWVGHTLHTIQRVRAFIFPTKIMSRKYKLIYKLIFHTYPHLKHTHTQDHMWSHRQEERELKRAEMEIVKQKKQLQRVMKNYESSKLVCVCVCVCVCV